MGFTGSFKLKYLRMKYIVVILLFFLSGIIHAQDIQTKSLPVYSVLDYGVRNDGMTMNTQQIQQLIDRVSYLGGGIVYFPPGNYLTGTIYLKSHINFHIESGAVILGSLDIDDYEPVGEEKLNHSARQQRHLIYYLLKHSKGGNLVFARSKPVGEVRWSVKSWAEKWNVDVKPSTGPPPIIRHILISNIMANSDGAIFIDGLKDGYIPSQ